jgi:tetratricopeptide (TPR) repeat protein
VTGIAAGVTARFAVPSLVLVVVTGALWVSINASVAVTIDRFERILTYDRSHASYAWENLAMLRHDRGELSEAISTMQIAVDYSKNPRQYVRLAVYLGEAGRVEEAKQVLEHVLERRPDFTKARFRLIVLLEKENAWGRILEVARDGVKYNPEEGIYHFFYGESLLQTGRKEEAIATFRSCQNMDLPASIKSYVHKVLQEQAPPGK